MRGHFMADRTDPPDVAPGQGPTAGLMSTLVAPGFRAVADQYRFSGASTGGRFRPPNDRVDILRTSRDEDAVKAGQGDAFIQKPSCNVKVLAIGPNVQTESSKSVIVGSTRRSNSIPTGGIHHPGAAHRPAFADPAGA